MKKERVVVLDCPSGLRIGQTIFNFLSWLYFKRGYSPYNGCPADAIEFCGMADPFYISDDDFMSLYNEFRSEITEGKYKNDDRTS